jgi:integrase
VSDPTAVSIDWYGHLRHLTPGRVAEGKQSIRQRRFVLVSSFGKPLCVHVRARRTVYDGRVFQNGRAGRAGSRARLQGAPAHAQARLRYKLANDGHDTRALQESLGHKNIQHTVIYTQLSPERFTEFWR